jgi:hypothetical protein
VPEPEPKPVSVLTALGELRRELQEKLAALVERRAGLDQELEALDKEIESVQRPLELVEARERQLAGQGRGQPDFEGGGDSEEHAGKGGSQARAIAEPTWPTGILCLWCDSLRPCQRLPSSGPVPRRPVSSRSLSPFPRGPFPWRCGRTTCWRG